MKTLLLLCAFCASANFLAQIPTRYEITKDGFTDFVVSDVQGKSKDEIYRKTVEWINKTYKDPKEVIKAEVVNDYVRIEGISDGLNCSAPLGMTLCQNVRYQIEISVKDSKYKFDVIEMETYMTPSTYSRGGWLPLYENNNTTFIFKKDGTIKGGWKDHYEKVPIYFNSLNADLKNYIESGVKSEAKSDW